MKRVAAVLLALAFTGCGEEDAVRATLDADARAAERRDWDAMCALRTGAAQRGFCPEEDADMDVTLGNEPVAVFYVHEGHVTDIDVDGDRATVRYDSDSVTRLRRVDDRWLIDSEG
ncbi:hypothetical protein DVA67_019510 [Solirubrobacter sp. CPCC 204708]|uniref:DUF4878 domain-containing protein n=1 Tax=Solirubrobacter deserti TaxID=2282478 RepID=A0ABT4RG04_9ACTN|nr:hypothetical protein [Solirubrobacter deserti]MBE2318178.1 hypothetical protein [Solirubrobacter deserti]MDA0137459.1 hypothetical protein [Solirubrobacter deserti]